MTSEDGTNFQFLAEHSADVICRVGPDLRLSYVSPASFKVLGYRSEQMLGMSPEALIVAEDLPVLYASIVSSAAPGAESKPIELRFRKQDGTSAWMEVSAGVQRHPVTGERLETVIVFRDISERKALVEKLTAQAMTDGLTGLANRRAFDEALQLEWRRTLRSGSQISLLLLDVDYFKEFNSQYGHRVGDDCLCAVAAAIKGAVRVTDFAARYGGDELAVILPSSENTGALEVAEKVRAAVEALQITHSENPRGGNVITVSVGAATALSRTGGKTRMPESLLLAADTALYKAKREGRNRTATSLLIAAKG